MRRMRGEGTRITFRLSAEERHEAERLARLKAQKLSDFVRDALREKMDRERGGPAGR